MVATGAAHRWVAPSFADGRWRYGGGDNATVGRAQPHSVFFADKLQ
jgi:hypothetical protein